MIPPNVSPEKIIGFPARNPAVSVTVIRLDTSAVAVAVTLIILGETVICVASLILFTKYSTPANNPPSVVPLNVIGFNMTKLLEEFIVS